MDRTRFQAVVNAKADSLRGGWCPMGEEASKAQIILPILRALGWDDESDAVEFEGAIGKDAVDLALCSGAKGRTRRLVLVEAKKANQPLRPIDEDQLGKYIGREAAPLAVLTNGREWWFYLVHVSGVPWRDRRFADLDLCEDTKEFCSTVWAVLSRDVIANDADQAVETAQSLWNARKDRKQAREALPSTWQRMVEEGDADLLRLLADKSGIEDIGAVKAFVRGLAVPDPDVGGKPDPPRVQRPGSATGPVPPRHARLLTASLAGRVLRVRYWNEILVECAKAAIDTGRLSLPWRRSPDTRIVLTRLKQDIPHENWRRSLPSGHWLDIWWGSDDCVAVARELLEAAGIGGQKLVVEWIPPPRQRS